MRAIALALCLALAAPGAASAEGAHHGTRAAPAKARRSPRAPSGTAGVHKAVPAPPPGVFRGFRGVIVPSPFLPRYVYDPFFYSFAPIWWGWGWGWGYYPLYPRPRYGYAPEQVSRFTTRFDLFGGGTLHHGGGAAGLALAAEGERWGMNLVFDGLYRGPGVVARRGSFLDSSTTYAHASAHFTAAVIATDVARLRFELGGALLAWPNAGPDAGLTVGGPDLGVSGQVGLVGPLAVEGYARLMPVPVPVSDVLAALAFRFGPLALTAGWRELAVHKSHVNAARFSFSGPQVGLGVQF